MNEGVNAEKLSDQIAREIADRKAELWPMVEEYNRLLAAEAVLSGDATGDTARRKK